MDSAKVAVFFLIVIVGLSSIYFVFKKSSDDKISFSSFSNGNEDESQIDKNPTFAPFQFNTDKLKTENKAGDGSLNIIAKIDDLADKIQSELKKSEIAPPEKLNIQSVGAKDFDEYLLALLESGKEISFTPEEFEVLKKNEDERPLSVEELIALAINGADLIELKDSFKAWQGIDERFLVKLKKIVINPKLIIAHQKLIAWYEYHAQFTKKLSAEDLSTGEIKSLFDQYLKKATTDAPKFYQSLGLKNNSLIPTVNAQTEVVFYHFGGQVESWEDICTTGIAFWVGPPRGGLLWIYYWTWAANPYLYKNLSPTACVLGRAVWGPGWCNKGKVNYFIGDATVVYFGSSLPGCPML